MRIISSILLLLVITACGPTNEPAVTREPPPPPVVVTDEQVTDDPVIDSIRKQQAEINERYTTGMLQQRNVVYNCNGLRGTAEVHRKDSLVVLVRNHYNDGENRTITDRFYYKNGELIHQFSETLRWEFDGSTQMDQNGNAVPGIINYVARYRYYMQEGKVARLLKRKFSFSSLEVEPAPESFPLEEATPPAELPYRSRLAQAVIKDGKVDCTVFQ